MNGTKEKLYAVQTFASEKAIIYGTKKIHVIKICTTFATSNIDIKRYLNY